jgi:hypothetical protein
MKMKKYRLFVNNSKHEVIFTKMFPSVYSAKLGAQIYYQNKLINWSPPQPAPYFEINDEHGTVECGKLTENGVTWEKV